MSVIWLLFHFQTRVIFSSSSTDFLEVPVWNVSYCWAFNVQPNPHVFYRSYWYRQGFYGLSKRALPSLILPKQGVCWILSYPVFLFQIVSFLLKFRCNRFSFVYSFLFSHFIFFMGFLFLFCLSLSFFLFWSKHALAPFTSPS